jgi:hypothetical protein
MWRKLSNWTPAVVGLRIGASGRAGAADDLISLIVGAQRYVRTAYVITLGVTRSGES